MSFDINRPIRSKVWKFGHSIDTDCIFPYYRYPKLEDLKKHTMESARPEFAREVSVGDIMVAGRNFGCGSGRPGKILFELGVVAVVADSFSTLFTRNCVSGGDLIFSVPGVSDLIEDGQILEVNYGDGYIKNAATGKTLPLRKYPPLIESLYQAGGMLAYTKAKYDAETAARRGSA